MFSPHCKTGDGMGKFEGWGRSLGHMHIHTDSIRQRQDSHSARFRIRVLFSCSFMLIKVLLHLHHLLLIDARFFCNLTEEACHLSASDGDRQGSRCMPESLCVAPRH